MLPAGRVVSPLGSGDMRADSRYEEVGGRDVSPFEVVDGRNVSSVKAIGGREAPSLETFTAFVASVLREQ